jgi:hypothetical protein
MSEHKKLLGNIPSADDKRDAIHVAIVPLVAGEQLQPGQHVGLHSAEVAVAVAPEMIGIVDPFLTRPVEPGELCWVCVYPGSITALRHDWIHPAFERADATHRMMQSMTGETASKLWIENYATTLGVTFEELLEGAELHHLDPGGCQLSGQSISDEFWDHYEKVVGHPVSESERSDFFSCGS